MSNRPVKKKKVVEVTEDDFEVEWTPPPRTARDRLIQFGVLFLIIAFLLPAVTCAIAPDPVQVDPAQQAQQNDPIEMSIKQYAGQLAENPNDPTVLANLGYYTTLKGARAGMTGGDKTEQMTLLATGENYLRDALKQDPDYGFALSELAKNLMMQEKQEEADQLIATALENVEPRLTAEDEVEANDAKSQKAELLTLSAMSDMQGGRAEEALETMNQVIELKPGEPRLYMARAEIKVAAGDKEAAREDLSTAVTIAQQIADQRTVMQAQQMIESLDNPSSSVEVIEMEEKAATPSPQETAAPQGTAAPEAQATPAVTPAPQTTP
jgi:tetratricopeptide (TPR) repeat protein